MNEYPWVPLGQLAAKGSGAIAIGPFGSRMKSEVYVDNGVPVIRGTNISKGRSLKGEWVYVSEDFAKSISNCIVREGDLVFPHRGAIGEVAIVSSRDGEMVLSTSMMKFRPDKNLANSTYLYYYFRSAAGRAEILRFGSQVGTPGIGQPLTSMRQFRVRLPPIETQEKIASILSALDDKINLNQGTNQNLETIVQAIFRAWFVDFEPVKAKAAGAKSFRGMPQRIFDQLPDRFSASEMGPVPVGWDVVRIDELMQINPQRPLKKGTLASYLAMTDMPTQGHSPDTWEYREFGSGMRFKNGDTLVARITPCLENGKTAYVDFLEDGEIGWGSTEYIVLAPRQPLPAIYAYCLARSVEFRMFAIKNMTGSSGRQRVSALSLAIFQVARSPSAVAGAFGSIAAPLINKIAGNQRESRTLAAIRDTLLPKFVSGEIGISEGAQGEDS
jgi:type I restriction enzyme, S subunit